MTFPTYLRRFHDMTWHQFAAIPDGEVRAAIHGDWLAHHKDRPNPLQIAHNALRSLLWTALGIAGVIVVAAVIRVTGAQ